MTSTADFKLAEYYSLNIRYRNVCSQYKVLHSEIQKLTSIIKESNVLCLPKTSSYFHQLRLTSLQHNKSKYRTLAFSLRKRINELNRF